MRTEPAGRWCIIVATMSVHVIDLSGSLIERGSCATPYLASFRAAVIGALDASAGDKAIVVTGGGDLARDYQTAYRRVVSTPSDDAQDWIGIAATRLHGELLRHAFAPDCCAPVITDPTAVKDFPGRVMIAAGWKPGFSTDYDAVLLAQRFAASTVIKMSNVAMVHSGDPRKDPEARPLERVTWEELARMGDGEWHPGSRLPFDPVATRAAGRNGMTVVFTGSDADNLRAILDGMPYRGTTIADR